MSLANTHACVILRGAGRGLKPMVAAAAWPNMDVLDQRLAALMQAAQAGDRNAYSSLLHACQPIIRRSAHRAGVLGDLVEDVVQETLLSLHHARQTYDPSRSFTAWLSVIAQRRGIDALRRSANRARRETHAPLVYDQYADPEADAARGWEEVGRARELRTVIDTLSPSQREAIEHLALKEQSLAEASRETGKTVGALKVNFHRGLKALKLRLSRADDPNV